MRPIDGDELSRRIYEDIPIKVFGTVKRMGEIRQIIDEEPTIGLQGWISVQDRLPEKKQTVMVSLVNEIDGHRMKRPQLGYPADDTGDMWYIVPWDEWAVDSDFKVTHWMPIPEPPEEVARMADLEKVIRGLECCTNQSPTYCRQCPYKATPDDYPRCVHMRLQADALALLKELEREEDDGK